MPVTARVERESQRRAGGGTGDKGKAREAKEIMNVPSGAILSSSAAAATTTNLPQKTTCRGGGSVTREVVVTLVLV